MCYSVGFRVDRPHRQQMTVPFTYFIKGPAEGREGDESEFTFYAIPLMEEMLADPDVRRASELTRREHFPEE
jgi:hypothetical protein